MSKRIPGLPERSKDPYIAHRRPWPRVDLSSPKTALLTIDMQYGCAHDDFGHVALARQNNRPEDGEYYSKRLRHTVLPAIQGLLAAFREAKRPVFHTHIESLSPAGHDRSRIHKNLGVDFKAGSRQTTYLEEISPRDDEIKFPKTTASPFISTNIDYVLRNYPIENLVIVGVLTTGCVSGAVRDAADRSYSVVVAEDACAAHVEEMHLAELRCLDQVYAEVCSASEVIERIGAKSV